MATACPPSVLGSACSVFSRRPAQELHGLSGHSQRDHRGGGAALPKHSAAMRMHAGPSTRHRALKVVCADGQLVQFSQDDFSVDRLLGTLGFMNVSSYGPPSVLDSPGLRLGDNIAAGYSVSDLSRMATQDVGEGAVRVRIYRGRIVTRGPRLGTRVILKAYPGREAGPAAAAEADALSANELVTHAVLQQPPDWDADSEGGDFQLCPNLCCLLGGFESSSGEKWLVLRDDGGYLTAADYARLAGEATSAGRAVGEPDFFDRFDARRSLSRREAFVLSLLRGALTGLAFMHSRGRLHQSLGPASVVLNTVEERDVQFLVPRLRDFAFSMDVSDPAALASSISSRPAQGAVAEARENLWRRAAAAGATGILDRRAFGLADDIYSAGLLVACMAFLPLCPPGSIDGPSLQRLLESTFRLDIGAVREYCAADERWGKAVEFLDRQDGSGWDLLQGMLNPEYRMRPSAEAVLRHPFLLQ